MWIVGVNFEYFLNEPPFLSQGSGGHEIACILLEIVSTVALTFVHGKSAKIKVIEKKASKWIKDVHILHKRHWKVFIHSIRC